MRRVTMPIDMRVKYEIQRQQLRDTKELANVLLILRRKEFRGFLILIKVVTFRTYDGRLKKVD